MKKLSIFLVILLALVIVISGVACGDSEKTKSELEYANVSQMRAALEANGIVGIDWWEGYILYAQTAGRLQLNSEHRLELITFANRQAESNYIAVGEGVGAVIVEGNLWAVVAETTADAQAAQAALGGEIR